MRNAIELQKGKIYENAGGGIFRCLESDLTTATVVNVRSGWCCRVIGTGVYPDGKIDWDYSKDGYFMAHYNDVYGG